MSSFIDNSLIYGIHLVFLLEMQVADCSDSYAFDHARWRFSSFVVFLRAFIGRSVSVNVNSWVGSPAGGHG